MLISQMHYSQDSGPLHNHYHLYCEMVFIEEGAAEFTISGKTYLAEENSMVFISSYEPHQVRVIRAPYHRYFAMVQAAELERAYPSSALTGIFKNRPEGFSHCVSLKAFGNEPKRILARLMEEFSGEKPYGEQMVRSLLAQVLILVYRSCPENFSTLESGVNNQIREVQQFIEENFSQDLKIADLAQRFYMNHCYLTHLFKKQVGYSPKQYLLLNRLSYGQELLETTGLSVSQIASRCGFGDANNFIRAFRESFGVPPNQFRQKRLAYRRQVPSQSKSPS